MRHDNHMTVIHNHWMHSDDQASTCIHEYTHTPHMNTYTHVDTRVHISNNTCMHGWMHIYTIYACRWYICIHACMYHCIYALVCLHVCLHTWMHNTHVDTQAHIYKLQWYVHAWMHIYTIRACMDDAHTHLHPCMDAHVHHTCMHECTYTPYMHACVACAWIHIHTTHACMMHVYVCNGCVWMVYVCMHACMLCMDVHMHVFMALLRSKAMPIPSMANVSFRHRPAGSPLPVSPCFCFHSFTQLTILRFLFGCSLLSGDSVREASVS
jgi:hypothetical protein